MSHRSKLTYPEQINHLKKKGITFIGINEAEAITYLKENNNFFKLLAYRKNFDKSRFCLSRRFSHTGHVS